MPEGLEPPCFAAIASALLEQLRHEASCQAIAEPFMRGLPPLARGVADAHRLLQRRLVLMAEAQRLFVIMAPFEGLIRSVAEIEPGTRKMDQPAPSTP